MKIKLDSDLCTGIGNCAIIAPAVFKLDEENKAVILDPDSVDRDTLLEAVENCPMEAITIEDHAGD